MSLIPVTILTGFLGSGKSTLLTQILRDPSFQKTAVIVNEFGDVGLDDFLVTHSTEQIVEMTTGCLCCTVRGDITQTLQQLYRDRENGSIPNFDRIIIETTGMADPAPVIHTLMTEPFVSGHFMLCGVVCTIDALNATTSLKHRTEATKQIALSDRIVITKTDLDEDEVKLKDLHNQIKQLNPAAKIQDKHHAHFSIAALFDTRLYNPASQSYDVREWMGAEKVHHHHHHNHHSDGLESFTVTLNEPVSAHAFQLAFRLLISTHGEHILRLKGIVHIQGRSQRPIIIHGVQHVFHDPLELDHWPDDDHRTRLVFITRDLPRASVEDFLTPWFSSETSTAHSVPVT